MQNIRRDAGADSPPTNPASDPATDSTAALDLKLKDIIRSLPEEAKPEAIRIVQRLIREARPNDE